MEFTYKGARAAVRGRAFGARRLVEWLMRRACSPFEAWGAWPRSRFAELASNCLKDNQTNAIPAKKLLRLASGRFLCVRTKRIFYLLSFPDVLNANGSRSYYSPLKAGSPAPLHNPLGLSVGKLGPGSVRLGILVRHDVVSDNALEAWGHVPDGIFLIH